MSPVSFSLTKRHLALEPRSLEAALEAEAMAQPLAAISPQHAEARAAFLARRK
jgi:hypothetical protein